METQMKQLRNKIFEVCKEDSMDFMGVGSTDRFEGVHYRMRPEAHLDGAKSVISIGMRYPIAMYENADRTKSESFMAMDSYENFGMTTTMLLAAMDVSRILEDFGYKAIPITMDQYRVNLYKDINESWSQDFRNDVAAVAAGHGEIGFNGVVITPKYGTRQRFTSIVTDAPLEADKMYDGASLCDMCMKCISACKMNALNKNSVEIVSVGEKEFKVAQKDRWRCMWSKEFNLNAEMQQFSVKTMLSPKILKS